MRDNNILAILAGNRRIGCFFDDLVIFKITASDLLTNHWRLFFV
ncbi:hypothetical protein yfred0001_38000 [Yersinia frederiksenii ATCC 33641]|nr:hypothetical protein yfred0001_38000 [Yersinia frederiksenii ATCC 33641]